jgi:hypothetical protein
VIVLDLRESPLTEAGRISEFPLGDWESRTGFPGFDGGGQQEHAISPTPP